MSKTSENGKQFILDCEESGQLKTHAYRKKGDVWTIACGNTFYEDGTPVKQGDVITPVRARELFENIVLQFEVDLTKLVTYALNQNQWDAMMSFIWNLGYYQLVGTKTIKALNAGHIAEFLCRHRTWIRSTNPEFTQGLMNRRKKEQELFNKPV